MRRPRHVAPDRYEQIRSAAKIYIHDQLATMARYGPAPKLSRARREKLLNDVMKPAIEIERYRAERPQEKP